MNKKAIIPPYMLLFYKQKYGDITRKIHIAPIYYSKIHVIPICENIIISFEKFHVTQYMRKYVHEFFVALI